jgi:hypothetical protein
MQMCLAFLLNATNLSLPTRTCYGIIISIEIEIYLVIQICVPDFLYKLFEKCESQFFIADSTRSLSILALQFGRVLDSVTGKKSGPIQKNITSESEDTGFVSRQGVRFLRIYTLQCCYYNLKCIVIVRTWEKINA